jgi:lysophospholipase L1-like esterase
MPAPPPLPRWKKLLFTAVVLLVPLVPIIGGELWLRATHGPPPPHDNLARLSQCWIQESGDAVGLRCHPASEANLDVTRVPERPRVVVLGGSSVRETWDQGPGRKPNFTDVLQLRHPELEFVNLGVAGLGAGSVARVSSELSALSPDAVVIYSGHNDYNGDVFNGRISGVSLWAAPLYRLIAKSWLHAELFRKRRIVPKKDPGAFINAVETGVALEIRPEVDDRFHDDLALAVSEAPAPVVLSTLLRNPGFPPSGHDVRGQPQCAGALQRLRRTMGDPVRSLSDIEAACGEGAVTEWLRFRVALRDRDEAAAKAHWERSLDLDALPMRAPATADLIIRAVAEEEGVRLVDLAETHGHRAPRRWFTDTLHLSAEGAEVIADGIEPALLEVLADED